MKKYLISILNMIVVWVCRIKSVTIVTIVGSIGKTLTRTIVQAAFDAAEISYRTTRGSMNTFDGLPFVLTKSEEIKNPIKKLYTYISSLVKIEPNSYLILEFGIDKVGEMDKFVECYHPEIVIVTALTEEHLEQLFTKEIARAEELKSCKYAKTVIYNSVLCGDIKDEVPEGVECCDVWGEYTLGDARRVDNMNLTFTITQSGKSSVEYTTNLSQREHVASILLALKLLDVCGYELALDQKNQFATSSKPEKGRFTLFPIGNSVYCIDDTYNASSESYKSAFREVKELTQGEKLVLVLGQMNEMGGESQRLHAELVEYIPQASEVFLVGKEMEVVEKMLLEKGIKVTWCNSPYEAGKYLSDIYREYIKSEHNGKLWIFAKGSQNLVYTEETLKYVLPQRLWDNLPRQSQNWLMKKQQQFGHEIQKYPKD